MKLAEMLDTSTSYIGEIEINNKVPSLGMVQKIAEALDVEPFRLFVDDINRTDENTPAGGDYFEYLSTTERQNLAKYIIALVSNGVEQALHPEALKVRA